MKKIILCGMALVAGLMSCTEDYTDWGTPQSNAANDPQTFEMMVEPTLRSIDFATYTEETVQLFTTNVGEGQIDGYTITISADDVDGTQTIQADAEGKVATADLQDAIAAMYGKAPTPRSLSLAVEAIVKNISTTEGTIAALAKALPFTLMATLDAPFIDENGYYVVGNIDGWACKRVDAYHMTNNGGNVYDNPEFSVELEPVDGITTYEIKMIPASDFNEDGSVKSWDRALSALSGVNDPANEGKFSDKNAGGNLKFNAVNGAKKYIVTINMMETTYNVSAVSYAPYVYFIGATDGWKGYDQKLESPQCNGVYTGYVYCADPNGWGNEFKFQRVAGSWDNEINSGTFTGGISGDFADGGGNIKATAGEGVYYVEMDLTAGTLKATRIVNMNLVGDFNGWKPDDAAQQMTWNATDFCFEITGAGVTANGWKFTTNNSWDINLGGTIDNLEANGANLSVVGSTIKLYPTRKTSDKIYCTVE